MCCVEMSSVFTASVVSGEDVGLGFVMVFWCGRSRDWWRGACSLRCVVVGYGCWSVHVEPECERPEGGLRALVRSLLVARDCDAARQADCAEKVA